MEEGTLEKAFPLLLTLTTKFPEYSRGFTALGRYHGLAKNLSESEKAYRKALYLDPASTRALSALGNICLESGRVAEARKLYRTCYEKGGNSPDLQYNLACVEALEKNYEASHKYLAEALKLGYRNLDAINGNTGFAHMRKLASFNNLITNYFGRP